MSAIYMLDHIYVYPYTLIMTELEFFKLLSDETRMRCLTLLQSEGELCVCELTFALGLSQPKISRHLAQLRLNGLVQDRRAGQWIHYRIHNELPEWIKSTLEITALNCKTHAPYRGDSEMLQSMPNRPGASCCA